MFFLSRKLDLSNVVTRWRQQPDERKMDSKSMQNRLASMEQRLKRENEHRKKDRNTVKLDLLASSPRRTRPRGFPAGDFGSPTRSPTRPSTTPSTVRMRKDAQTPWSPQSPKPPDRSSGEIEQKYQEIMKQTGILTLNGDKYRIDDGGFEKLGDLGRGTCGHVVKMRHKATGSLLAVKQMRRSGNKEENKRIIMDLDVVLKSHDCPYIVQCLGVYITSSDVWICMELMATCLDKLLKRLSKPIPERIIGKMAVAIVNALNYLKENHGVIHRDVKPSNILLDERGTVKLCDFGISGRLVDSKAKTRSAGCAAYMAPERIDPPDPTHPDYDIRADVWSLGLTLVELATGEFPYKNCRSDFEMCTKVLQEEPPFLATSRGFSSNFCSFVGQCLTKDFSRRPKYKQLLSHDFLKIFQMANVDVASWFAEVMATTESPLVDSLPNTPGTPFGTSR